MAVSAPAPGAALVLVAALLTLLDALGFAHLLRRPLGTRASQNVESREESDKPGVLVIAAGYDSPRESGALALATRVLRDPYLAMVLAMLVLLACCALRVAGVDGTALTVAQFVPTVLLILLTPALVDVELSGSGPDPAGAAAAAAALRAGEELAGRLDHFAVWVVLTGANQPSALGMRAWLRRHRDELDRESTAVVAIGPLGDGPVHHSRREGAVVPQRSHTDLVRLSARGGRGLRRRGRRGELRGARDHQRRPRPGAPAAGHHGGHGGHRARRRRGGGAGGRVHPRAGRAAGRRGRALAALRKLSSEAHGRLTTPGHGAPRQPPRRYREMAYKSAFSSAVPAARSAGNNSDSDTGRRRKRRRRRRRARRRRDTNT